MTPGKRFVPFLLVFSSIILFLFLIMQPLTILQYRDSIAVLFPKGIIALEERNLLLIIQAIMLLVIIPVYVLTFIFSWKYRANNLKAKYDPDFDDNRLAEYLWWGIPLFFTLIIGVLTWVKTYELDPLRPLESDKKPITIQVVALQWKWLFIYPEEKIASLNFLQIPEQIPIHFEITADAPMNSFWIPHLGGQIYAMPKMKTQLHLIANATGDFRGSSANISGEGFAGMHFITRASSEEDYHKWVESVKQSSNVLNLDEYNKLAAPSSNVPPEIYQLKDDNLFEQVLMKYMHPKGD
ncbi:ubiquinol oxidase subunit II [Parachlamydia acanthamoebae]|uniref:Ubiquinol oxidase polypeptide II n=3 Tax=Parachlamydiaceae TaxID=92713 RepID=F8KUU6_PARAV|nr:ubiquinol oxidase subunit II [Parachlamydia acanthamoebae]CCB85011.1 ubiquinol oxidase subunit 2 [Parachlamydia acanthamoebae UV-7]